MSPPRSVVVVPARDEETRIEACLRALAGQTVGRETFSVVVVLDACRDRTGDVASGAASRFGLRVHIAPSPGRGAGWARRVGMDLACEMLLRDGDGCGLIASTDADSRVAPDWLARQRHHVARGARAIAGAIELDAEEAAALPEGVVERRATIAVERLHDVRRTDPSAAHHHFGGASFAVTAAVYRRVGGIEALPVLEDAAFARRLRAHGVPVLRTADVRVATSARRDGRARRGLAADLDALATGPPYASTGGVP